MAYDKIVPFSFVSFVLALSNNPNEQPSELEFTPKDQEFGSLALNFSVAHEPNFIPPRSQKIRFFRRIPPYTATKSRVNPTPTKFLQSYLELELSSKSELHAGKIHGSARSSKQTKCSRLEALFYLRGALGPKL